MRTNRLHALLALAAALLLPGAAGAGNCYSIYDARNQLAFQSTVPPVDLSARISVAMRERFPGGFLIMIPDDGDCREYRTGPTTPRFDTGKAVQPANEVMQAPLLRGAEAPIGSEGAAREREAVRKGDSLRIRKP